MLRPQLAKWQWEGYSRYHQSRFNVLLHMVVVPIFLVGNLALLVAIYRGSWVYAAVGFAAMLLSVAAQGLGHRQEAVAPEPFLNRADAIARIFCEQWITFPRFVLSGRWWRQLRRPLPRTQPAAMQIRFEDGAGYERYMGQWSQLVGATFLDWLTPPAGLHWLDVGCGNGAFTELLVQRCAPASIQGIDPSEAQLAFARARPALRAAQFHQGDAMALPLPDHAFDAAVMPLVIFFVPDPARGVMEMVRVVRPGGWVAAYAWDMLGGGFPYETLRAEMRALGVEVPTPPSPDASRIEALKDLWAGVGLTAIETRQITVQRTFADFDDYWATVHLGPSVGARLAAMSPDDLALLKTRMRARLAPDAAGRITYGAQANAIVGRVPKLT